MYVYTPSALLFSVAAVKKFNPTPRPTKLYAHAYIYRAARIHLTRLPRCPTRLAGPGIHVYTHTPIRWYWN